uniref:Uncharacterized protein n=1 Tax=Stegastes partitus TaxID=144197 RepID=A0A3B5A7H3_9TELE
GDVSVSRSFVFSAAASKQQERRAMATLDRQIPSPDTFLCEPWSSFVSAAKLRFVDSKFARRHYYRLQKSNIIQFPALEDFCLVVCHVCSKVVTPRGILTHYGKAHTPPQGAVVHFTVAHKCGYHQLSHRQCLCI